MKRVMYTNISGVVFHIDDDAYATLREYLDALNKHFGKTPESTEIVADIEARIAELLHTRPGGPDRVINLYDVKQVIEILGMPEDIGEKPEGTEGESSVTSEKSTPPKGKYPKRMYRDPYNARIAGVCSGLALYFKIDPVLIRVLFIAAFLAYGASFWAYIILWIALPKAVTTAQRLEMYGEHVNINTIEKKVREDLEQDSPQSREYGRMYTGNSGTTRLMKLLSVLIGIFILLISLPLLIGAFAMTAIAPAVFSFIPWYAIDPELLRFLEATGGLTLLTKISLCVLALTPLIALILLALRLIFNARTLNRWFFIPLLVLWFSALITLSILGATSRLTVNNLKNIPPPEWIRHHSDPFHYESDYPTPTLPSTSEPDSTWVGPSNEKGLPSDSMLVKKD